MTALQETPQPPSDAWIGATIKGVAALKGKSMKELAMALGLNPSTLSNKVHGRSTWTAIELDRSARFLGVDVASLLDGYHGQVPFPANPVASNDGGGIITHEEAAACHITYGLAA